MLYLALSGLIIFVFYKLCIYDETIQLNEGFENIINKFKNTRNRNLNNSKSNKKSNKKLGKKKKSGVSFDDLVTEAEDMDPDKYTVDNIKNNFFNYLESFQKAKFKNVSGTTNEALEKLTFFKDQFFQIFK